jgi:small multidrug resistance pump
MSIINNMWLLLIIIIIVESLSLALLAAGVKYSNNIYILGILGYALVAFIFYLILKTKKPLTKANTLWNIGSIVLITLIGLIIFKEKIDIYQSIGLLLAFISILFIEHDNIYKLYISINN